MNRRMFTLVELLVLIAIIAILATLFMPLLQNAVNTSRTVTCSNQLRQIVTTSHTYAQDYHGFLPQANPNNWMSLMKPYLGNTFACTYSYWLAHPGSQNLAYCPAYSRDMSSSGWPAPQIPRCGYWEVTSYNANYVIDLRPDSYDGQIHFQGARLGAIRYPSQVVLFAESNTHQQLWQWSSAQIFYNPRHAYCGSSVRADGSTLLQPYDELYSSSTCLPWLFGSAMSLKLYVWRSWGYDTIYPNKR